MKPKFSFLTSGEITPSGWMRTQLEIEANGLAGNLDKVWPDVRDSKWIGGDREGWERVPYWLDGFIPLAYLLGNEDMIARAGKYIEAILAAQCGDGWICPSGDTPREKYDTWAIELITKVLFVYYDCSGDERIPGAVYRALKNWYDGLADGSFKLFAWARSRWFETFVALNRLAEIYGKEDWMISFAHILKEQGIDWPAESEKWNVWYNEWTHETHIVNVAMMMKAEAVSSELLGDEYRDDAEKMYGILTKYHGSPVGGFHGDECLAGRSPVRGFELCSVVELMYSYEWLFAVTGQSKWAERLEKLAFNALPATISDDMWTHQYDQMTNQNACRFQRGRPLFGTNGVESHYFGLEPNYGCCTANFGQGWPKLALSSVMRSKDGLRVVTPVPAKVGIDHKGTAVSLEIRSGYPFENRIEFIVDAASDTSFALEFAVPSFAKNAMLDGAPVKTGAVKRKGFKAGRTVISLSFETLPGMHRSTKELYYVQKGSLVFTLPVREKWVMHEFVRKDVERKFPYCDYELIPESDWNYGFDGKDQPLTESFHGIGEIPFSSKEPPVTLKARVAKINWGLKPGYRYTCADYPASRVKTGDTEELELVPYGCAKLRMTELPVCIEAKKTF